MPALLDPLDEATCFRRLASVPIGRVIASSGALPLVVPVTFALDGRAVVFRTSADGALVRATDDAVVAFEVDEVDPVLHSGWSVVVTGIAARVTDVSELVRLSQLGLAPWAPGQRNHWVRITPGLVTGRHLLPSGS